MSVFARAAAGALGLAMVALGLTVPVSGAAASSGAPGRLGFVPSSGVASAPLTAVSTGVCSDPRGTNLQLRVSGKGFPPGTNVTPNLKAAIYPVDPSTGGYDVPLQDTLHDFAAQQHPPAVLSGRYDFTLLCKKPWGVGVYDSYVGALWFSSPTSFHALTSVAAPTSPATTVPAVSSAPRPSVTKQPAPTTTHAPPLPSATPRVAHTTAAPALTKPSTPVDPNTQHALPPTRTPVSAAPTRRVASTTSPPAVVTRQSGTAPGATADVVTPRTESSSASPFAASVAAAPPPGHAANTGWLVALAAGSLSVVVALGLVARRRFASRGSA